MVVSGLHQEVLHAYSMCLRSVSMSMNSSESATRLMALCEISMDHTG